MNCSMTKILNMFFPDFFKQDQPQQPSKFKIIINPKCVTGVLENLLISEYSKKKIVHISFLHYYY